MCARASAGTALLLTLSLAGCGEHVARPAVLTGPVVVSGELAVQRIAVPVSPDRRIGVLLADDSEQHSCTASVLHSAHGNLVLTAAHCLAGGLPVGFVPGFAGESRPSGVWRIDAVYLDPRWIADTDPRADYAILRVGRDGAGPIEDADRPGLVLDTSPHSGELVRVTGYPYGVGGEPLGCQGTVALSATGFPSLTCAGLVDGTSGSPWVHGTSVDGVTGGYDGGGCDPDMSYASPFDDATERLLERAQRGGPGDVAPDSYQATC